MSELIRNPVFVLVRPQMGENIGAAARAMLNFRLASMRLVAPRDGWPNPRAVATASGAASTVLDYAGVFEDTARAVEDCDFVFATTARGRDLAKPIYTPEEAMAVAHARVAAGQKVGVLFGPERTGLENDDIARANAIITIPTNPDFFSLNLAQAVLLFSYEFSRQLSRAVPAIDPGIGKGEMASQLDIEKLGDHYEGALETAGYFFPEDRAALMRMQLRNMWSRFGLTHADVQALHGLLRQLVYVGDHPERREP